MVVLKVIAMAMAMAISMAMAMTMAMTQFIFLTGLRDKDLRWVSFTFYLFLYQLKNMILSKQR